MKKDNQMEIKIRDISFIPDWNTLLSLPLFVEEVRSNLLYPF